MHRKDILTNAITHTCGERDKEYGSPTKNLQDCAALWGAYLGSKYSDRPIGEAGYEITPEDVAWMNVLQKIARTFSGAVPKADTYEDAAAYCGIAGECADPTPSALAYVPRKCNTCGYLSTFAGETHTCKLART